MSEQRHSVDRLLRRAGSFSDPATPTPGTDWRESLLLQIADEEHPATARPPAAEVAAGPLRLRHLVMMSPAGVALFGLGWWVGRGGVSPEEIAAVPSAVWLAGAAIIAVGTLWWIGVPRMHFRRDH